MNLKQLRTEIRINIDDKNFSDETEDTLRLLINRAIRKVEKELLKAGVYLKTRELDLSFTADTQEVAITGSYYINRIIALLDEDRQPLDIVEREQALRSQTECYYIRRGTTTDGVVSGNTRIDYLGYYVVPTSSWDVTLIVNETFTEFSSSDSVATELTDIPPQHHDCIVTWATIQFLFGDAEAIPEHWVGQWNDQINDLINSVGMENKNYQTVTDVYGD